MCSRKLIISPELHIGAKLVGFVITKLHAVLITKYFICIICATDCKTSLHIIKCTRSSSLVNL